MNNENKAQPDAYRSLLLMSELERGDPVSQREIAGRLGIAVGLVNAYLKTLVRKGFVQVKAYPRNRYAYLLTPSGFAEKSRLAYQQVAYFNRLFRVAREDSRRLFQKLVSEGIKSVAFCGIDEFSEIVYLSLQEARLELRGVLDDTRTETFFNHPVNPVSTVDSVARPVVITTVRNTDRLRRQLLDLGVAAGDIYLAATMAECSGNVGCR